MNKSNGTAARAALAVRIRERLAVVGLNAHQAGLKASLGPTAIYDILSGKNKNPNIDAIRALARVLKCSPGYLRGEADAAETVRDDETISDLFGQIRELRLRAFREGYATAMAEVSATAKAKADNSAA